MITRRMRKQPNRIYNPRDLDLEPGMRVYGPISGYVYDLEESPHPAKAARGELYPRKAKKPHPYAKVVLLDGIWYWQWSL